MSRFVTDLIEGKKLLEDGTLKNNAELKQWILNAKAPKRFSKRRNYFNRVFPVDFQLRLMKSFTHRESNRIYQ